MVIHFPHALRVAAVFIAALALAAISTGGPHALNAAPPHETVNGSMQGADPEAKPDEVLVRLRLPATSVTAVSVARSVGATVSEVKSRSGVIILNLPEAQIDNALERLKRNPLVQQAGRNLLARVAAAPDDPGYPAQWHLHDTEGGIFAESAWDLAPNLGTGVIIAIIDTGMAYESYIDPSGRVFTPSPDLAAATFVASWDFQAGDSHANDEHGHGTHMAGTIASSTGNGYGVAGIAPQASIMPLKVLGGNGTGTAADVVESIFYAVDSGARVINMSLGFPGTGAPDASGQYCTEIVGLGAALDYAYTSNVTVVAAAGNDNGPVICPAAYPSAIAVGATRFDGTIAYYSNRGASLDVTAPGGDDRADQNGDGSIDGVLQNSYCSDPSTLRQSGRYDEFCDVFKVGTSSATAHVTGLVALLLGEQSGLTPDQVRSLVQATARDRGLTGWDSDYGWGTIDARAALEALHGGGPPPPPEPTPGPTPAPPPVTPNRSYPPSIQSLDVPFARVIDGDVLEIRVDGVLWGVRYIGVDAPAGNTPCGRQATARNWELTAGGVHLELEAPYDLDAAGLRLYHVSNTAGELIGETLIREGLARVTDEAHQYRDRYLAAEEEARTAGRGCLWSGNAAELQPAPQPVDAPPAVEEGPSIEAIIPVPGFEEVVVASHLSLPTSFDFTPDGRIFIAEQRGVVRVVKDGVLLATPLIDIQSRVNDYWDRGLLGIAVDPDFAANGYVYLLYAYENNANDYTGRKTARLTRVTVIGDQASPASEVVILGTVVGVSCNDFPVDADCIPSDSPSHSVGNVRFGPDGYMYVTTGDAAHFNFVDGDALRAQDLDLLAGKVLRINRDGTGVPDNPFWNGDPSANRSKVWARGVRNAFRFNVRPTTGTPYLGDVGWNTWEEINIVRKGVNLGWPCYEGVGQQPGYGSDPVCKSLYALGSTAVTSPVYQWENGGGGAAAVGGDFAITYPSPYTDAYFFGDYVRSWIKYLQADANDNVISIQDFTSDGADGPVAFETGLDGEIYYLAINVGELRHIRSTAGNRNPVAVAEAEPTSGLAPLTVTFSSTGSSDPDLDPLAFEWDFGDGSPTSNEAAPEHTYTGNGVYTATLVVRDGQGGESSDTVTITVGNRAPIITISEPLADSIYKTGDTISFVGSAVDPEDGTLPPSSLAWTITLHHNTHTHPFLTATGESGSFVVPDHGDDSFFEIVLTATDNSGLQSSLRVFIRPQEVHLTFDTSPSGLAIIYDGRLLQAPVTVTTIANSVRTIDTPSPQFQGALEYTFTSWSDSGAQKHDINTGVTDATLIASFNATVTSPITFDDIAGQNQVLSGQYPSGIIDWGSSGQWWHSEPWGLFTTKSVTFNGPGITSATFTFATPHRLVRLDAYNGSTTGTTVTLSCPGQPNKQTLLASLQLLTIDTGWAATCSSVTIASSNGWDTNFDNLVIASAPGEPDTTPPAISNVAAQSITSSSAQIVWQTNEPATSQVEWGTDTNYGNTTSLDSTLVTQHSQTIISLAPEQTYHYRVLSRDAAGNASVSPDFMFTTPASAPTTRTITFDDIAGQNQVLSGQYPSGVIDWGSSGQWWHSEPWGLFTTKSVTFNGPGITSATFTFATPHRLVRLDAYNGGSRSTTVTLSCPGQPNKQVTVNARRLLTIDTGWTATCSSVTIASSNGWNTNFDNLVVAGAPGASSTTPLATSTDADSNSSARSSPTSTTASSDNDMKAQLGEWSPLLPWPIVAVHAALLPNGKVLMWDAWEFGVTTGKLWDPGTNSFTDVDIDSQLFCSGHVFLADGRLLVAGGHDGGEVGIEDAYVFSYASQGWSRLPDMHVARWYPTTTTLGDGRVVAFSGQITHDVFADVPEIYDPATNTWSILNVDTSSMHDHEYPLNFLLPNGQIYSIGATPGVAGILDVVSPAWTDMGAIPKRFGSAVMYRPGKVLYSGGGIERGQPATNEAFVLDLTQGGAAWEQTSSMGHPRYQHNLVMLPDGKVIAIGGAQSVQQDAATGTLAVEVWDPTTGTWTTMASMADPRNYHSVALLLPDGRVLSAGGGRPHGASSPPAYLSAQIYSPPYLFKGARPIITTAPDVSAYGASITVETPDAADIVAVSLISLPSVTHSLDMNQHYLELSFVPGLNEVRVTLPANQNLAPPGYYMLFLINSQGVPSVAHTMRISAPDANTPIPSGVSAQNVTSGTPIVWQTDDPALSQVEG